MTAFRSRTIRAVARQRGSTLTGLIIGLIVGLGIAVAVALTITKGASPFTDKVAKSGRPADPAPGQAMDPNKPMYANRDAAREANKEVTEKAAARSAKPADPAAAPAAPAAPAASADPLGQAIASMEAKPAAKPPAARDSHPLATAAAVPAAAPAASPAAPAAAAGEYIYYLQAGAFRDMSDAEATRAKLALLGFEAAISDRTSDSGVLHRVRIGPYNHVESMNKARAKLLDSGVDVAIVRNQR
ncbi:cell division protein [Massilia sp. WF1]|uniref:SPOR domain-containing protein n=1 Tax=unclassified Massilia TaxID=2609279 RepID=UPI00064ABABE|nr:MULTISPECIES: SPOR domain-containing protein [unclassified Massilia]ALK95705.1 cell division protein [Massilia sp. WG5]KLU34858.1 cell division protein [Massilia sp. WF1]